MPEPAVADQLKIEPSSLPDRFTVNGAAPVETVAIGFKGALMTGGAFEPTVHVWIGDAVLRGFGAPKLKSVALLSVSVQPPRIRSAAVVLVRAAVTVPSEQFAAPYPMR